jgi:hypothetical protein
MSDEQKDNVIFLSFKGIVDLIKGFLQIRKIKKKNTVQVEFIDNSGLIHDQYTGLINSFGIAAVILDKSAF